MATTTVDCETPAFDLKQLVDRCLGNIGLAERIIAKFEAGFDRDLAELEAALRNEDCGAVAVVAHRLKGASANVSARRLQETAADVERLSREGNLLEVPEAVQSLRLEQSRFSAALAVLSGDPARLPVDRKCRPEAISDA